MPFLFYQFFFMYLLEYFQMEERSLNYSRHTQWYNSYGRQDTNECSGLSLQLFSNNDLIPLNLTKMINQVFCFSSIILNSWIQRHLMCFSVVWLCFPLTCRVSADASRTSPQLTLSTFDTSLAVFGRALALWNDEVPQICVPFLSRAESSHFSKELCFLLVGNGIKGQDLCVGVKWLFSKHIREHNLEKEGCGCCKLVQASDLRMPSYNPSSSTL